MTSWVVPLKQYNTQSRISLEILKQCSLNLAPEMYITKETKWHPSCNSYAAGPVLIKSNITRFYLNQGSSTPSNLMGRVQIIWESCVFRARLCPFSKGHKLAYLVFHRKRREPKVLSCQQHRRCHSVSFVMQICGAKFEEHCFNISRDILDWVLYCFSATTYDVITFLICIIQKLLNISKMKKDIPKRKTPFFCTFKSLSNKQ